jgi:hypothetical protein
MFLNNFSKKFSNNLSRNFSSSTTRLTKKWPGMGSHNSLPSSTNTFQHFPAWARKSLSGDERYIAPVLAVGGAAAASFIGSLHDEKVSEDTKVLSGFTAATSVAVGGSAAIAAGSARSALAFPLGAVTAATIMNWDKVKDLIQAPSPHSVALVGSQAASSPFALLGYYLAAQSATTKSLSEIIKELSVKRLLAGLPHLTARLGTAGIRLPITLHAMDFYKGFNFSEHSTNFLAVVTGSGIETAITGPIEMRELAKYLGRGGVGRPGLALGFLWLRNVATLAPFAGALGASSDNSAKLEEALVEGFLCGALSVPFHSACVRTVAGMDISQVAKEFKREITTTSGANKLLQQALFKGFAVDMVVAIVYLLMPYVDLLKGHTSETAYKAVVSYASSKFGLESCADKSESYESGR